MLALLIIFSTTLLVTEGAVKKVSPEEQNSEFWYKIGHEDLMMKIKQLKNKRLAKNIIVFIGDGMGPSTLAAARIYKNQRMVNSTSPDVDLALHSLPNVGLAKTYSVDDYVADSSSTATAILTGVKIRSQVVGVSPNVYYEKCSSYNASVDNLVSIGTMFYKKNKSVGIVTTTTITHATPASLYAHTPSRRWEYSVPDNCSVDDIALQLFKKAHQFQVILGGGSDYFIPKSLNGKRNDNRDLLSEWKDKMKNFKSVLLTNSTEFRKVDVDNTDYLFGLLNRGHLNFDPYRGDQPSLKEMTATAINILSKNKNGYFLLVEGGRIDHAHHQSKAVLAILETLAMDKAVEYAVKSTNDKDTLIIVTADHSHVFTVGSYEHRDIDITKKNKAISGEELDKKGHTSFLYANGPGYAEPRKNITDNTIFDINYVYSSGVPMEDETHGGEDLGVFSSGPWAHLLNGVHQQSFIGHMMMYASCSGRYEKSYHCNQANVKRITSKLYFASLHIIWIYFKTRF